MFIYKADLQLVCFLKVILVVKIWKYFHIVWKVSWAPSVSVTLSLLLWPPGPSSPPSSIPHHLATKVMPCSGGLPEPALALNNVCCLLGPHDTVVDKSLKIILIYVYFHSTKINLFLLWNRSKEHSLSVAVGGCIAL